MKRNLLLFYSFFILALLNGQEIDKRIVVNKGGSVDFIFKSMYEITNGKTLGGAVGFTNINLYFDTIGTVLPDVKGWELRASATSNTFQADYGSPNLDLDKIVMDVSVNNSGIGSTLELRFDATTVIATGDIDDGPIWNIQITYDCAKQMGDIGMLNVSSDYYYTEIHFTIEPSY